MGCTLDDGSESQGDTVVQGVVSALDYCIVLGGMSCGLSPDLLNSNRFACPVRALI
jgi:hypothetical protein